jgi:hypothetical protein
VIKNIIKEVKNNIWEMANIEKKVTGLSVNIYISEKNSSHGPRIKLSKEGHNFICSITIENEPKIIGNCKIKQKELNKIIEWIKINKDILLDLWNMKIGHYEAITKLDMSIFN